jgi:hypothetical protein
MQAVLAHVFKLACCACCAGVVVVAVVAVVVVGVVGAVVVVGAGRRRDARGGDKVCSFVKSFWAVRGDE